MDLWGEEGWLVGGLLALTYGLQAVQILWLPVPSSFSTWSLMIRRWQGGSAGTDGLGVGRLALLATCATGALVGGLLPLAVCLAPGLHPALLPLFAPCLPLTLIAGLLLVLGSGLSLAAVLTLRAQAVFDASGESEVLITSGIFRLCRHPVLVGLGAIYLAFVLLLPSGVLVGGFLLFLVNARARAAFEEAALGRRFGAAYRSYAAGGGRLGPQRAK